jgi:hypothetical protein
MPTLEQIRDTMPFATLVGAELMELTRELVRGRMEFSAQPAV